MECAKIRDFLSEYIDDSLDAQTKALIDEHLLACPICKEELHSMKAMVKRLGSIEPVKAPDDFLEQLHERMEPRVSLKKIMRTLFIPGRIKIPLEFAAAAAMAILIFSTLNIQQAEKLIPHFPESSTQVATPTPVSRSEQALPSPSDSVELLAGKEKGLGEGVRTTKGIPEYLDETESKKGVYKPKPVVDEEIAWQPTEKGKLIELALVLKKEAPPKAFAPGAAMEMDGTLRRNAKKSRVGKLAPPKEKMKRDALQGGDRVLGAVTNESPALKEAPRSSFSIYNEMISQVKDLIGLAEGKIISMEYERGTERPKSIRAEIPAKSYKSFYNKLKQLAVLQTPAPIISKEGQRPIQVRIRFILQ